MVQFLPTQDEVIATITLLLTTRCEEKAYKKHNGTDPK